MAPYCTAATSSSTTTTVEKNPCQSKTTAATPAEAKRPLNVLWAAEKRIKKLQEHNRKLIREMSEVEEIVNEKYPDLTAARIVQSDALKREYDENRWRVRIALKSLANKAEKMIETALDEQLTMLNDIETKLQFNRAAIAKLEKIRKGPSRKRNVNSWDSDDEEGDWKRGRFE